MADTYPSTQVAAQSDPANGSILIDYSVTDQDVTVPMRSLYITTAGDLKVDTAAGQVGVTRPFIVGLAPLKVTKIYKTGSTAAGQIWF